MSVNRKLLGCAHQPNLDHMSPAQIRVLCEQLLYTMGPEQREKLKEAFPGIYKQVYHNAF